MTKRVLRRGFLGLVTVIMGYLVLLAYPQPLFAYELTHAGLALHADRPGLAA